jgi:hypothetical protein
MGKEVGIGLNGSRRARTLQEIAAIKSLVRLRQCGYSMWTLVEFAALTM